MDSDYAMPGEVDRIRASVSKVMGGGPNATEVQTWVGEFSVSNEQPSEPGVHRLPATFGVLADDADIDREIVIELDALAAGGDEVLVSRRVRTGFVRGETRLVRLLLYRACEGVQCAAAETCGCPGPVSCTVPSCVSEELPAEELERIDNPSVLPPDAGIPTPDGGAPDGGVPDGSVPPSDGGTEPDASVPDGGGIVCGAPLTVCGVECVNTDADPRHCGGCERACPSGHVCESGTCIDPGDCRIGDNSCSGFTYCEPATGECLPGCTEAEQCTGDNQVCDAEVHDCVCSPGFDLCDVGCVDTQNDPVFCGNCATSCPSGHACDSGTCLDAGDCRTNGVGCSGFTYCDEATGDCLRGCHEDEQCVEPDEECDTLAHDCTCSAGFHQCGNVCVSDLDPDSCGASCTPCPAPPNSSASCDLSVCGFVCESTYERCDQMCCPTSCPPGQALYDRTCAKMHVQVADPQGTRGEHTSIALDSSGLAHIGYYASSGGDLIYTEQQIDATWAAETPEGPDDVGKYASIAVDAAGVVYVAYYDSSDGVLMFATRQAGGAWTVEVVDGDGDVGEHTSLALDASGDPHISYYDKGNRDLMYATRRNGGTWSIETVDGDGGDSDDVGQYTSLALGSSGAVHISYYVSTGRDLRYATRQVGGPWTRQTVDSDGDVGKYSSLALDDAGTVHISYYGESDKDLLYTTEVAPGSWAVEPVETEGNVGKYTSLAFDGNGAARVSYYDEIARDLKYAVRMADQTWSVQVVDAVDDVGRYTSIAVDDLGQAHMSYYDATNKSLKYALVAAPE
jgi:hypothetical protein